MSGDLDAHRDTSMTIAQLMEILSRYDPAMAVMVSDDGGVFDASAFDVQLIRVQTKLGGRAICIAAHETATARQELAEVKCPSCGWVHVAIPRHHAEQTVVDENAERQRSGDVASASMDRFLKCFRCGEAPERFVPAQEADAPAGCTLQPVVVSRT